MARTPASQASNGSSTLPGATIMYLPPQCFYAFFNFQINYKYMIRHFNTTVYICNPKNKKFLFVLHKKLNKWVSPGGHIDNNENPEESALREVKEETGLNVKLLGDRYPEESDLIRPFGIQLNIISTGEHEHFDLIYLATPIDSMSEVLNGKESLGIKWFSLGEITDPSFNSFEKNKKWCTYFDSFLKSGEARKIHSAEGGV